MISVTSKTPTVSSVLIYGSRHYKTNGFVIIWSVGKITSQKWDIITRPSKSLKITKWACKPLLIISAYFELICRTSCKPLHNATPSTWNVTGWNASRPLLQAVWTRFFPVSVEIKRLLAQGEVGEVKIVRSEFGVPVNHLPRSKLKELGGGAMLDLGIYCLQFTCMVYDGEKPECIQATGVCLESGNEHQTRLLNLGPFVNVWGSAAFAAPHIMTDGSF